MKNHKTLFKWIFIIGAVAAVIWMNRVQLPRIYHALVNMSPILLILALICSFCYFFLEGTIITLLSRKYRSDFTVNEGITGAFFCQFYRMLTLGSGTAISEVYYLHTRNVAAAKATGMCLVQYLAQRITIAFLGLLSGIYIYTSYSDIVVDHKNQIILSYGISLIVVCAIIFAGTCHRAVNHLFTFFERLINPLSSASRRLFAIKHQVNLFQLACLELLREGGRLVKLFFLNILKILCQMAIPAILLFDEKHPEDFFMMLSLAGMVYVLAGVIPAPGGIGSLEWVFILLFQEIMPIEAATAAVIVNRLFFSLLPFLVGAVVSAIQHPDKQAFSQFEQI